MAIRCGNASVVEAIIKDLKPNSKIKNEALIEASSYGHTQKFVQALLDAGANVNKAKGYYNVYCVDTALDAAVYL